MGGVFLFHWAKDMPMVAPRKPQIFRILQQYAVSISCICNLLDILYYIVVENKNVVLHRELLGYHLAAIARRVSLVFVFWRYKAPPMPPAPWLLACLFVAVCSSLFF